MEEGIQLEVGKRYVCRDADHIRYVEVLAIDERLPGDDQVIAIECDKDGDCNVIGYCKNGFYLLNETSYYDLVAEYKEPKTLDAIIHLHEGDIVSVSFPERNIDHRPWSIKRLGSKRITLVEGEFDDVP